MRKPLEKAILETLCYADIFDYPLKKGEIWHQLISKNKVQGLEFKKALRKLRHNALVAYSRNYYFLKDQGKIVALRRKREKWSQEKFKRAQKIAGLLKIVPTIKMVAVTGNLAVKNCTRDDDIDFLIVASSGNLWLTRLLTVFSLEAIRKRRRPGQENVRDKICLNMFMDEGSLMVPLKEQDLYTAHEVSQLNPLWDRDKTYQKFLAANLWAKSYLPNTTKSRIKKQELKIKNKNLLIRPLEQVCRHLQLWYMRKHRTTEIITKGMVRFHPQDARRWVLREYRKRLKNLPLDK